MKKMRKLTLFLAVAGTGALYMQSAGAWWGGNKWFGNDDDWWDRPGLPRGSPETGQGRFQDQVRLVQQAQTRQGLRPLALVDTGLRQPRLGLRTQVLQGRTDVRLGAAQVRFGHIRTGSRRDVATNQKQQGFRPAQAGLLYGESMSTRAPCPPK